MKKKLITVLILTSVFFNLSAKAEYTSKTGFEGHYLFHTTKKCVDFKKSEALQWHDNNINKNKFYYLSFYHPEFHNAKNEVAFMKGEALEWYGNNVDKNKFYYRRLNHSAVSEIAFLKKKALRWYERNSQS